MTYKSFSRAAGVIPRTELEGG